MEDLIIKKEEDPLTKPLTEEEYGSKMPFSLETLIAEHVRKEEATRYDELFFETPVPLPRFEKVKVEKTKINLAGVYNFFKNNVLLELRP